MFTIENSLRAIEQFKTKEELAGLFLELTEQLFGSAKEISDLNNELTTLKEQNKKLRECVEFYANTTSWENEHTEACHTISGIITEKDVYQPWGDAGISVGGRSAKKCLEEIERMG